jgi:hypothetical protein
MAIIKELYMDGKMAVRSTPLLPGTIEQLGSYTVSKDEAFTIYRRPLFATTELVIPSNEAFLREFLGDNVEIAVSLERTDPYTVRITRETVTHANHKVSTFRFYHRYHINEANIRNYPSEEDQKMGRQWVYKYQTVTGDHLEILHPPTKHISICILP